LTGQTQFQSGTGGCSLIHQQFVAVVDTPQGPTANLLIDVCVNFGAVGMFDLRGTFVFTSRSGTLSGNANGTEPVAEAPVPIHFTLSVLQGTRGFSKTSGLLFAAITWAGGNPGPFAGTLTASLSR
jgi:hypothetical protein